MDEKMSVRKEGRVRERNGKDEGMMITRHREGLSKTEKIQDQWGRCA